MTGSTWGSTWGRGRDVLGCFRGVSGAWVILVCVGVRRDLSVWVGCGVGLLWGMLGWVEVCWSGWRDGGVGGVGEGSDGVDG